MKALTSPPQGKKSNSEVREVVEMGLDRDCPLVATHVYLNEDVGPSWKELNFGKQILVSFKFFSF